MLFARASVEGRLVINFCGLVEAEAEAEGKKCFILSNTNNN